MMKLQDAIVKAKRLAHKRMLPYYVVYSRDEEDIPGNDYHVSNEFNLDTFFCGCQILYCSEDV